jgi:hypothetical protein
MAPLLILAIAVPRAGFAQGYRLKVDTRAQAVAYRGVQLDSIPVADTVTGPTGGPSTPDGFAVDCVAGLPYCSFFRPGPQQDARPVTGNADLTVWGLGLPGLSIHAIARLAGSFSSADPWPGTEPSAQLLESYAQYAMRRLTLRLGRQTMATVPGSPDSTAAGSPCATAATASISRATGLGTVARLGASHHQPGAEPARRVPPAGADGRRRRRCRLDDVSRDVRLTYEREVDPSVHYFVSERMGVDAGVRPYRGVTFGRG